MGITFHSRLDGSKTSCFRGQCFLAFVLLRLLYFNHTFTLIMSGVYGFHRICWIVLQCHCRRTVCENREALSYFVVISMNVSSFALTQKTYYSTVGSIKSLLLKTYAIHFHFHSSIRNNHLTGTTERQKSWSNDGSPRRS